MRAAKMLLVSGLELYIHILNTYFFWKILVDIAFGPYFTTIALSPNKSTNNEVVN